MRTHRTADTPRHTADGRPPWAGRVDVGDGTTRGRGGGRSRGRGGNRPPFGRHGDFGPGFGRSRARRGDVRSAILALLAEEPMHGYQVITELTERSEGAWAPSPGSVYPTLSALEDQGLVTAEHIDGKRVFTLTTAGRVEADAGGDTPAPWELAAGGDTSGRDLRDLMVQVAKATMQVGQAGTASQIKAAAGVLADARRKIYLVLAEGDVPEEPAAG